jgi:hypothetical protein
MMERLPQRYVQRDISELKQHPRNPRKGNVALIQESIEHNGWYGVVLVQKSTGYIIAGNHRVQAASATGATKVPILEVDCDDDTATRILLADNRTNDTATYDEDSLAEILKELSGVDGALEGTGYKQEDYDDIIAALQEHEYSVDHNVVVRPTLEERMERYKEATTRSIMLAYQLPDFEYVVEQLETIRNKFGVDNNAMTIVRLIEQETGVKAPAS